MYIFPQIYAQKFVETFAEILAIAKITARICNIFCSAYKSANICVVFAEFYAVNYAEILSEYILQNITYFLRNILQEIRSAFYFCKKIVSFADAFCRKFLADQGAGGRELVIVSMG